MTSFLVTPQQAYALAGSPHGPVAGDFGPCLNCSGSLCAYSAAGFRELGITGFCEPCYDYLLTPDDEREPWMAAVETDTAPDSGDAILGRLASLLGGAIDAERAS